MTHGLQLLEGRRDGSHFLCPSDPEKWRSVVMLTPLPSSGRKEGRRQGGKVTMVSALLILISRGVSSKPSSIPLLDLPPSLF